MKQYTAFALLLIPLTLTGAACGANLPTGGGPPSPDAPQVGTVFVVAMENHGASDIYGNLGDAPYINQSLMPAGAHATHYADDLPHEQSEPHYIWMLAGTNRFDDWTANSDDDPSAHNSTASTEHLVTQLTDANLRWKAYQEGLSAATGDCPVHSAGLFAAKHDPFVFFSSISGNPPSPDNVDCAAHHGSLDTLTADLAAGTVANFNFVTPNLCDDMHGASGCPSNETKAGDHWLETNLPPMLDYANAHNGIVMVVWDEPSGSGAIPFIALGPTINPGYASGTHYSHSSLLKSVEQMLGLPVLPTVTDANPFGDLFLSTQQ